MMKNAKIVRSMTGFASGSACNEASTIKISIEIKSVNHRFLEVRFKRPTELTSLDHRLKKLLEKKCVRGSFDVFIKAEYLENATIPMWDEDRVNALLKQCEQFGKKPYVLDVVSLATSERFQKVKGKFDELDQELILKVFDETLLELDQFRCREGEVLLENLRDFLREYELLMEKIHSARHTNLAKELEQYKKSMSELLNSTEKLNLSEDRLHQEVLLLLQKRDIEEEIQRTHAHLGHMSTLLSGGNREVGKELDFLTQELLREANTMGSKTGSAEISKYIIQLKLLIDKIKEQAMNLE